MKKLDKNWFCSHPIDLEQKQYILLDFLQGIQNDLSLEVLYPWMSEVHYHLTDLSEFTQKQAELKEKFKRIKKLNFQTLEMEYEYDDSWITKDLLEIHQIVEYSLPELKKWWANGKRLFDSVSKSMKWEVVGLTPIYKDEGYFIIHVQQKELFVYRFSVERIILNDENYFGITTKLVDSIKSGLRNYEDLKHSMIRTFQDLPLPYTLSIETKDYPLDETILPIVKREGLTRIKNSF